MLTFFFGLKIWCAGRASSITRTLWPVSPRLALSAIWFSLSSRSLSVARLASTIFLRVRYSLYGPWKRSTSAREPAKRRESSSACAFLFS